MKDPLRDILYKIPFSPAQPLLSLPLLQNYDFLQNSLSVICECVSLRSESDVVFFFFFGALTVLSLSLSLGGALRVC